MDREYGSILAMLNMDTDPYRNGVDACCIVHTGAGRYKTALNELRPFINGFPVENSEESLREMRDACLDILEAGYCMAEVYAKLYVLGLTV